MLPIKYMMMNDGTKDTSLKFNNKDEITRAIQVLTPFINILGKAGEKYPWAEEKIKELVKLL